MEEIGIMEEAGRLWVNALNQSIGVENTASENAKLSINESFEKQIDAWDGNTVGFSFVVGTTSSAIPTLLEKPILIMESKTVKERLVVLGELQSKNGNLVPVILELYPTNRKGNALNIIIKIASAYGRKNTQNLINKSKILYIEPKKNRTQNWLKVNRLRLPLLSTNFDPIYSIRNPEQKTIVLRKNSASRPLLKKRRT